MRRQSNEPNVASRSYRSGKPASTFASTFMLRRPSRRFNILLSALVTFSFLLSPYAGSSVLAPRAASSSVPADPLTYSPPPPEVRQAPPVVDPHLPSLMLDMEVSSYGVSVGSVATITITLYNQSPDPADNVEVTLPLPIATTPQLPIICPPGDPACYRFQPPGWRWTYAQVAGKSSVTMNAVVIVAGPPSGNALVAKAQATATGISVPAVKTGGAILLPPNTTTSTVYTPGAQAILTSPDESTQTTVPPNAYNSPLVMYHSHVPLPGDPTPPRIAGLKEGFPTFYLQARNQQGREVSQFSAPLTIKIRYTPQQLQALGIAEEDLTLFWFDESRPNGGKWVPIDTVVDNVARTATARVTHFTHFTPWQLSDGSSPSAAYLPSLQGWQVGLYQGDMSYSSPIEVPAGPAGIRPNLTLSYNSSTDSSQRATDQASWVGKGWSLDTGYVALNKLAGTGVAPAISRWYSMDNHTTW